MEAGLQHSVQSGRQRTSNALLPEQLLEIAQESILKLRQSGVVIQYFMKDGATVLVLRGVCVCFQCGCWQFWEGMTGNLCQQCADARKQP